MKAVYAGSFDPITLGHCDLIERASKMCDELIVAVGNNSKKKYMFSPDTRLYFVDQCIKDIKNVKVEYFTGLLVEFLHKIDCRVIIRGVRAFSDFESELQIASVNRYLDPDIETIFMMPKEEYSCLSSSTVRELIQLGMSPHDLVHDNIIPSIAMEMERKKNGL